MKRNLLTLLFFISISTIINIQGITISGYLSVNEPYKFNLPMQGLRMSMPANTGFIVPSLSGKGVFLDMDKNVDYFMSSLSDDCTFKFSLTNSDTSYLQLDITPTESFFANTYLEKIRRSSNSFEKISPLKNDIGKSISYSDKVYGKKRNFYVFFFEGNLYKFSMPAEIVDKAKYESIIKGVKKELFQKEMAKYNDHQKSAYHNNKEKEQDIIATAEEPELRTIKGLNPEDHTIYFPQEGLSYLLPKDYVYEIDARKLIDAQNGGIEVYRAESDKKKPIFFSVNRGPQAWFYFRSKFKQPNDDLKGFSNMANGGKMIYNYFKDFDIVVDGVKGGATFYGSPFSGTVELWFENENTYFSFSLYEISKDNIDFFDQLLSSIKIDTGHKRVKYDKERPLSSVFFLEDRPAATLDKLDIPSAMAPDLSSFRCSFSTLGITTYLPGTPDKYTYGLETNWGKDILTLDEQGRTPLAPSKDVMFVTMRSSGNGYSVNLTLYLNYGKSYSAKQVVERHIVELPWLKGQESYKSAGLITTEDGSEWGVYIRESGCEAIVFGGNEVYNIYYTIKTSSPERLNNILAMLYKFKNQ